MQDELEMGNKKFTIGSPIVGSLAEPGAYPTGACPDAILSPQRLLPNSKLIIKSRRAAVADPHGGDPWTDALNQVDMGWLACFRLVRKGNK